MSQRAVVLKGSLVSGPTTAAIVSIIGGILMAASGLVWGYVVLIAGLMTYYQSRRHVAWGIVIILPSILGLAAGRPPSLFGLVGGIASVAWKPGALRPIYSLPETIPSA